MEKKKIPRRFLVINPDFAGYGSTIARGLQEKGIKATVLPITINGLIPFLRDKVGPRIGLGGFKKAHLEEYQQRILENIWENGYDSVLCVFDEVVVTEETLSLLKSGGRSVKLILWLYDNIQRRPTCYRLLQYFDHIFTFQSSDIPAIRRHTSAPVSPLLLFCDGRDYKYDPRCDEDIDLCFVGAWNGYHYKKRRALLRRAASLAQRHNLKMVVIGKSGLGTLVKYFRDLTYARGFRQFVRSGPLSHSQINDLYQRSKIVLNNPVDSQIDGYPMRTFEVPASGNCLLTQYMAGLEDIFSIPDEIVTFTSLDDFEGICLELLKNDERRKAVADAGRMRVFNEHMLGNRLDVVIDSVVQI